MIFLAYLLILPCAALIDGLLLHGAGAWTISSATASTVAFVLRLFSADAVATGATLRYQHFSYLIIPDCTGIDAIGLFIAAMVALPLSWQHRLRGLLLGVPMLFMTNITRVVLLVVIAPRWPILFELGHVYVAPLIVLMVALGLWMYWAVGVSDAISH